MAGRRRTYRRREPLRTELPPGELAELRRLKRAAGDALLDVPKEFLGAAIAPVTAFPRMYMGIRDGFREADTFGRSLCAFGKAAGIVLFGYPFYVTGLAGRGYDPDEPPWLHGTSWRFFGSLATWMGRSYQYHKKKHESRVGFFTRIR